MGLVFWSMGAISPRLYTVPFQQEPALGQWSLVLLGTAANSGMQQPASKHVAYKQWQAWHSSMGAVNICCPFYAQFAFAAQSVCG